MRPDAPPGNKGRISGRPGFPPRRLSGPYREATFPWAGEKRRPQAAAPEIAGFKASQQAAFEAERARRKEAGLDGFVAGEGAGVDEGEAPEGCAGVESPVPGNVWKLPVEPGTRVQAGEKLAIIESMKMEIAVSAPAAGRLRECRAGPGRPLRAGDPVAILEEG